VEDPNFHYETEADKLVKEQVLTNEPKPGEDLGADVLTQDPETAPQFTALMLEIHIKRKLGLLSVCACRDKGNKLLKYGNYKF